MIVSTPRFEEWTTITSIIAAVPATWEANLGGAYGPAFCLKFNGKYYLYYIGSENAVGPDNRSLGVATSQDGVAWAKHGGNPIIDFSPNPAEDEEGVFSACGMVVGGTVYLYYGGLRNTGGSNVDIEIRARKSVDGLTFTDDTLIYQDVGGEHTPVATYKDGANWYVYYLGPLAGGAGAIRLRSGTAWDVLGTDQLVEAGSYKNGDLNWVTPRFFVLTHENGASEILNLRVAERDAPTSLATIYDNHDFGLETNDRNHSLFLDKDNDVWWLFSRASGASSDIYMQTAPANYGPIRLSSDDAEERGAGGIGTPNLDSSDLELNYDPGSANIAQTIGVRFSGIMIPRGAAITNAFVRFKGDGASSGSLTFTISGEDALNPGTFTTASQNITDRTDTTATVSWSPGAWSDGVDFDTPNLKEIIQEIIEQSGWDAGNAIVMMIPPDTGTDTRRAFSFDDGVSPPPQLFIEYKLPVSVLSPMGHPMIVRQEFVDKTAVLVGEYISPFPAHRRAT